MPNIGQFVLHSQANPPLKAGDYVLQGRARTSPAGTTEPYDGARARDRAALRAAAGPDPVDLPARQQRRRVRAPPAPGRPQAPHAAVGARPAERGHGPTRRGSRSWSSPRARAQLSARPAGRRVRDARDACSAGTDGRRAGRLPRRSRETVVDKVFPTAEDLPLLAHVREVDIDDTELANGDDDGWLAVVMRQPPAAVDRHDGKPVRYLACLVNLEGQLDACPSRASTSPRVPGHRARLRRARRRGGRGPGRPRPRRHGRTSPARRTFGAPGSAPPLRAAPRSAAAAESPTRGAWPPSRSTRAAGKATHGAVVDGADPRRAGGAERRPGRGGPRRARRRCSRASATTSSTRRSSRSTASRCSRTGRSPSSSGGDFEPLMQELDVGLLGTGGRGADVPPGAPPPARHRARPPAEVAETGHVGLPPPTRRGDAVRAWYRGPLVPHPDRRATRPATTAAAARPRQRPAARASCPTAARTSRSPRRSRSAGCSRCRSPPSCAALMRWRAEQFGADARRAARRRVSDVDHRRACLERRRRATSSAALVGLQHRARPPRRTRREALGPRPAGRRPGPRRSRPTATSTQVLAAGFGLDLAAVRQASTSARRCSPRCAAPTCPWPRADEREPPVDGRRGRGASREPPARGGRPADRRRARGRRRPARAARDTRRRTADALDELIARATPQEEA